MADPAPDMDDLFLSGLKNGAAATPGMDPGSEAPPSDMDQMFLTKLRPEVAKPKGSARAEGRPVVTISPHSGELPDVGKPALDVGQDQEKPGDWNIGHSLAYGMTQGWSPEIVAKVHEMLGGGTYHENLEKLKGARKEYQEAGNSGKDLAATLLGSTATALPLMAAGQEYAAVPLANTLARAMPAIKPILSFLSGGAKGIGALPSQAVRGGVEGVASSGLQLHMGEEPVGDQLKSGALMGGALGPVGNMLMKPFTSKINSTVAQAAKDYMDMGGDIRAGQLPGAAPALRTLDNWFSKPKTAAQLENFNEHLTNQAGVPAKHIDQDWVTLADAKNGNTMNSLVGAHEIPQAEPQLVNDLIGVKALAQTKLSADAEKKVGGLLDKIDDAMTKGPISGDIYRAWTQKGGLLDNYASGKDIEIARFVRNEVKDALDSAWGRALGPGEKAEWDQARKQYKNTRIIDSRIDPATGNFDPRKLLKPVENSYGNVINADKGGQMGTLAKAGQFITPEEKFGHGMPNSVLKSITKTGAAVAAGTAAAHAAQEHGMDLIHAAIAHPAEMSIATMLAGSSYLGAKGLNEMMNSPRYTRHLLDQVLSGKHGKSIAPYLPAATYVGTPRE